VKAKITSEVNPRLKTLHQAMQLDRREMDTMKDWIDTEFTQYEKRLFSTEGAAGGSRWPALSPAYAKAKQRRFPGRKIMQRSGKLRRSLVNKRDAAHVAKALLKPRRAIEVGTRNETAAFHISGSALKNPRVPHRDVMQYGPRQAARYAKAITTYLKDIKLPRVEKILAAWKRGPRRRVA
jgi:phage gpG-like protein